MKLDRLLAITMLLLNRTRVSAKELSDRFEVSLRTVYRDIETINQAGIPIVSYPGAAGGYAIMEQYRLERQFLSLEELHSIIIGLKGIRSTVGEQEIGTLLDKVGALVARSEQKHDSQPHNQFVIDIKPWNDNPIEKEKLNLLRETIRQTRLVDFQYISSQSELSSRTVEPMGIVVKGFHWYLYAYCLLRQDYRVFRLSRMKDIQALPNTFTRRSDMVDSFSYSMNRAGDESPHVKLLLHVQPSARAQAEDYFQPDSINMQPDGTLLVTSVQPDEPWLYGMLLSYGPSLRVIEPPHIADIVRAKAQQTADLYN